ncbi:hypothetical protein NEUTE1DRAFT_44158 [Neurospora tetrasperma FGSC 2508]|uniref:F-box domain-containing protein n=1 Tax=Neurospora tetrasperma (strain FGSC 2508 / ATCC MYA-4615 / P0657) TaxID=510951 RepID=F8MR47_NEUT8|nr:uncharacterized protein NEUTE1DRAFT_44158 [Neurospora tetrasperma FGSC 2508]EGO56827.1 hypothetical protein NEUTE1DRAFT_44158 [Neurospora tetrasperma FGSC 2508]EGZ70283.1 hypothetical protein NEUTE2DRAFT_68492 [Neurospora tetrasperma FGSC 2509]
MSHVKRTRLDAGFPDTPSAIPEAMENALAQQFEALGPNAGLRLANLRSLVSSLTPQETRFMRLHLQSLPAPADIISSFPVDILIDISPYLSALDIVNILAVSKAWRQAWSQRHVVGALAKHHMPNFLQLYAHRNRLPTDQNLFDSFYQAARKFSIRQQGLFQSMIFNPVPWLHSVTRDRFFSLESSGAIESWDDVFPGGNFNNDFPDHLTEKKAEGKPPYSYINLLYRNGKVAWQPDDDDDDNLSSLTFVDDLRSQQRKVYKVPISVVLLGCVAHLEDLGSERDSVTLPSANIYKVSIEGKRAYILTDNSEVYVWTFRGGIRKVDTSAAGEDGINRIVNVVHDMEMEGMFDILPHPFLDDKFYLFSFRESERMLVVHEFNHNGTLRIHTTTLPKVYSLTRKWGTGDFDFEISCEGTEPNGDEDFFRDERHKVDAYGNYTICQFFAKGRPVKPKEFRGLYDDKWKDWNCEAYHDEDDDYCLGYTVLFNALTASVSISPFISNIRRPDQFPPSLTFWGGQQIELIRAPTTGNNLDFCMLLVSELNGQKRVQSMDDLPIYCPSTINAAKPISVTRRVTTRLDNSPAKKMMQGHKCSNIVSRYLTERLELISSIQPQYGLEITFEYDQLRCCINAELTEGDGTFELKADEDFLVCVSPEGYVAWSFYHDMKDLQVKA